MISELRHDHGVTLRRQHEALTEKDAVTLYEEALERKRRRKFIKVAVLAAALLGLAIAFGWTS